MANIQRGNKTKNLVKFLVAALVLVILWAFFNDSTYNTIKKGFVKNADKYLEMYAYTKSKPSFTDKYFIVQGNEAAKSFFKKEVNVVDEGGLNSVKCSGSETVLLYEKPSRKISDFVRGKGGEELVLNRGTDIEFYIAKIKVSAESCNANL